MNKTDFLAFATFWQDVHNSMAAGKSFSETNMRFIFEALEPYPLEFIKQATTQYSRREKFAPAPSDIIRLLEMGNKRPTADEAWTNAPKDESLSAWQTEEEFNAWCAVSGQFYGGDKIGARMGFKAIYERFCDEADVMNKPVKKILRRGFDKSHLKTTVEQGVIYGYLPRQDAENILLGTDQPKTTVDALIAKTGVEESKKKNIAAMCRGLLAEIERVDAEEENAKREKEEAEKQQRLEMIAKAEQELARQKAANDDIQQEATA